MGAYRSFHKCIVAALFLFGILSHPAAAADEDRINRLFAQLQEADPVEARKIAKEIELEWTKSGSSAMDLLLKRGVDALEAGDAEAAIEHLTALTDHAPDFAEAYHRRAVAYAQAEMFGPAVADIERALALRPRHFNAIASLGGILAEIDRPELAIEAFRAALALHPHHQDVSEALDHLEAQTRGADL